MPSARRVKVFGLLLLIFVVTVLFYTASLRQQRPRDLSTVNEFYAKTVKALDKQKQAEEENQSDEESKAMLQRLKDAASLAKEKANAKAPKPDPPSNVIGVGSSAEGTRDERGVAGRKKFTVGEKEGGKEEEETMEEHNVEVELGRILKMAPIIIFSKSYCPYSKKAKQILLEKYTINPPPYVVELDKHELGPQLQALLGAKTNRRTVPNVLINAISIGGGDDVAELDSKGALAEKIKELGGKKIVEVSKKAVDEGHGL